MTGGINRLASKSETLAIWATCRSICKSCLFHHEGYLFLCLNIVERIFRRCDSICEQAGLYSPALFFNA